MTAEYILTPNATLLDLTSETRFKNGLMRLLAPLLAGVSKAPSHE